MKLVRRHAHLLQDDPRLIVTNLRTGYGAMEVIHGVSFEVGTHEIVAFVGRNGAGKTTILHAVAGIRHGRTSGRILLGDNELSGQPAARIAGTGLALVPAGHRVFTSLSVDENLRLGAHGERRVLSSAQLSGRLEQVRALFPILGTYASRPAGQLSGGEQQMVAIGQALMSAPKLLLLDEPASGLAPPVVRDIFGSLKELRSAGMGVLVVEQNLDRGLAASDRCYVIEGGRVAKSGTSRSLTSDADVQAIVSGLSVT